MEKILLNLVGVTHDDDKHSGWKKSNIKNNIIECLNKKYDVKIYFTTYFFDDNTKELIDYYNPELISILEWEGSEQILTYIHSLKSLLKEEADFIISTRFDMFFHKTIDEIENIDFTKFNFLFKEKGWWGHHRFTTDTFYIFPKKYLEKLIESMEELYKNQPRENCTDMHGIYNFIVPKIGENNINLISNEEMLSHDNKFYKLTRFI